MNSIVSRLLSFTLLDSQFVVPHLLEPPDEPGCCAVATGMRSCWRQGVHVCCLLAFVFTGKTGIIKAVIRWMDMRDVQPDEENK